MRANIDGQHGVVLGPRMIARRWKPSGETLRRVRKNRGAMVGAIILSLLVATAILAPHVVPFNPIAPKPEDRLQGPSFGHLLGTDEIGRDVFSRVIVGSRISLRVGLISTGISLFFGLVLGLPAGYRGGLLGAVIMRTVDVMLAVPGILLAVAMVAALGPSIENVMIAVGIAGVARFTRLIYACVLAAKENVYVDAARCVGCTGFRIAVRHILPNVFAPALVLSTLYVAQAILNAAALSFLGLGAVAPEPEWGLILSQGRSYMRDAWWISTFPGVAIMVSVLSINLLGDGLRDALDPRLKI